ncbi:MAG: phosphatase PAP2 family protein [Thermoanaerobaculia bacterium]
MNGLARLWPEERIALLFFFGVLALFAVRLYPFTLWPLVAAYLPFLLAISVFVLPPWVVVALVRRVRGKSVSGGFLKSLATYLRALLALLVVLVAYTNLKCRLLLFHPQLFDRILAHLDDTLHMGGGDFVAWVTSFHSPPRTLALHLVYYYAWLALALPLAVAMARSGVALVRRTLAALTLCYVAGVFVYLAFPSLGPALVERGRYAALVGSHTFDLQQSMLEALRYIVQNPQAPAVPFFGLAAFPSLHLATSVLGIFVAWKVWRPLLLLLVPWNLAIVASAIYYGWHYAIDFYPALLLAWGGWWAAGRLTETRP